MANIDHIQILSEGAFTWNNWRANNPEIIPDLADFDFTKYWTSKEVDPAISGGERWVKNHWDCHSINLINVDLSRADLTNCILSRKHVVKSNFSGADLSGSLLNDVLLKDSDFSNALFHNVNFNGATIVECNFNGANISNSYVFGTSSWGRGVTFEGAKQSNLIITKRGEDVITVNDIRDANLVYNFYNNRSSVYTIDSLSNKIVFIIGNFSPKRKSTLDAIKTELRLLNFIPLVFDFDKPQNKNLKETVLLFANLSKFIIADLTDGRSVPRELEIIAPHLTSVVIQPIILSGKKVHGMLEDIFALAQVLPLFKYDSTEQLVESLKLTIIISVNERIHELRRKNNR